MKTLVINQNNFVTNDGIINLTNLTQLGLKHNEFVTDDAI